MENYHGEECRRQCESHEQLSNAVVTMTVQMAGIVRTSNRLFAVGMALISVAIGAIYYAGSMNERILSLERAVHKMERIINER